MQHASQQIVILESQKLALQNQGTVQPTPTQPPVQHSQVQEQSLPSMLTGDCDGLPGSQNNLNGSSNAANFIANNRADTRMTTIPPPLMSQNIPMPRPGMNLNFLSSQQQPQQRMTFPNENNFSVSYRLLPRY